MNLRLSFKETKDGGFQVALPWSARAAFALIALVLAAAAWLPIEGGETGPLAPVAILVMALAACYEERWRAYPAKRVLNFRFGLIFLAKTLSIPYEKLAAITLENFTKGGRSDTARNSSSLSPRRFLSPKRYLRLGLLLHDGNTLVVETAPIDKAETLRAAGRFMAAAFELEAPRETTL